MATTQTISPDPALEAHVFWFKHRRQIVIAIVAVIVAGLVYGAYWLYADRRDRSAAAALALARDPAAYQQVINQYGSTDAGKTAYLLMAEAQRKDGKYADSNATLQKFVEQNPKHELAPIAKTGIAANLQSLGRIDEALAAYQRVAADYPKSFVAPQALIAQLTILKQKGQIDAARRIAETLVSQYRDSIWSSEAMQQLRQLKPVTPPGSAPGLPGGPALGSQPPNAPPPMLARPPGPPAQAASAPPPGAPPAPSASAPKTAPKKP